MKIENRQKFLVILAVVGVGLLLGDKIIVSPLINSWNNRTERIAALKKQVADDETLLKNRTSFLARWERMKTNALPQDKSLAESKVLNALENWTQASGIRIERRQPQWREDEDTTMLELNIDATGEIGSVSRFLYGMERDLSKLALKIEQLDVARRDNNGQQIMLTLQLTGLVLGTPATEPR